MPRTIDLQRLEIFSQTLVDPVWNAHSNIRFEDKMNVLMFDGAIWVITAVDSKRDVINIIAPKKISLYGVIGCAVGSARFERSICRLILEDNNVCTHADVEPDSGQQLRQSVAK